METIGVLSILEGKPYKVVKKLWKIFEEKYNSVGVQVFSHPNITFQAGETENLKQLKKDFEILVNEIKPFEIEVDGFGHFDKKVIYLKVKKNSGLIEINKKVNDFLRSYCFKLFEYYTPKNWIPHITLAMGDLTKENFEIAWNELRNKKFRFKQRLHNLCIVKWYPSGKIKIVKKFNLKGVIP